MKRVLLALPDRTVRTLDALALDRQYGGNRSALIRDAITLRLAVDLADGARPGRGRV